MDSFWLTGLFGFLGVFFRNYLEFLSFCIFPNPTIKQSSSQRIQKYNLRILLCLWRPTLVLFFEETFFLLLLSFKEDEVGRLPWNLPTGSGSRLLFSTFSLFLFSSDSFWLLAQMGLSHTDAPFVAISCSLPLLSLHLLWRALRFDSPAPDSAGLADSSPGEEAAGVGALKLAPVSAHTGEQTLVDVTHTNTRKLWADGQSGFVTALSPFCKNNKIQNNIEL